MLIVLKKEFPGNVIQIELNVEISGKEKSADKTVVILLYLLFRRVFVQKHDVELKKAAIMDLLIKTVEAEEIELNSYVIVMLMEIQGIYRYYENIVESMKC